MRMSNFYIMIDISKHLNIEEIKSALKGLPKQEKIDSIQQEINYIGLSMMPKPIRSGAFDKSENEKTKEKLKHLENDARLLQLETLKEEIKNMPVAIEDYLHNEFNIEVYEDLTESEDWEGLFEPLEFFNLLYAEFEFFKTNVEKYVLIKQHFSKIDLKEHQLYYFFWALNELLETEYPAEDFDEGVIYKSCQYIENLCSKVKKQLYPNDNETEETENTVTPLTLNSIKQHAEALPTYKEKLKYLIETKTACEQNYSNVWETALDETPLHKQIELEIKKLKEFAALEKDEKQTVVKAKLPVTFKLRDSILSKADFIRIINALSEMKAFEKINLNGEAPNKKDVMIAFGNIVGLDLNNYNTDLNKALDQSESKNFEIFDKMKDKATKIWNERKPRK